MILKNVRAGVIALAGASMLAFAAPAMAGDSTREGFVFPADGSMKIVVFRPDVSVGTQKAGGIVEPNADWTETARTNIKARLIERAAALNASLEFVDELEGENADVLTEYRALFEAVSASIFTHVTVGDTLATKQKLVSDPKVPDARPKKVNQLDWTLGPGAVKLKEATGADYAMFVFTNDAYGDAGRKVAQVLMAGLFGAYIPAGIHVGYAGLVDLSTGDVVWFNTDLAMGGDPREVDGADKRVGQLLEGFPLRAGFGPAEKAK